MGRIPIALQLYSVRKDCENDLPGVLEAVAKMGYDGVEFAGYYGRSAQELRKMLDDLGLKVAGTHIGLDTLLGDEFQKTVEFNQVLGNRFLIVPGLGPKRRESKAAWQETAQLFNAIAERLKPHGMRTGYHNHMIEFHELDGEIPWYTFCDATNKDVVTQVDIGHVVHGGADPVEVLKRYPGRAATVHVADYSATNDKALLGQGDVHWADVFRELDAQGATDWYIIEQESYAYPPLECVDRCLKALKAMGR